MSAITVLARGMARRQLVGLVLLAVIGGLGLGIAMTSATDARRADSAYDRLRRDALGPDVMFDGSGLEDADLDRLAALPEVAGIARFSYTPVAPRPLTPGVDGGAFVGLDADFLVRVYRPVVLSGRLPAPAAADEVLVNEAMARVGHVTAGQRVQLLSGFEEPVPLGEATVVGVVRGIFDVGANAGNPSMLLSERFLDAHRDVVLLGPQPGAMVRLAGGEADLATFQGRASAALGRAANAMFSGSEEAKPTNRTLRVQSVGLVLLAVVAGLATLAAVVQALKRVLERALVDMPTLVAMGVEPRQRVVLGALLAAPVALLGALVATGATALASPLIPTGFARRVDPLRGVHPDAAILAVGAITWTVAVIGAGSWQAWRLGGDPEEATATGRVHRLLSALPYRVRLGCESALLPLRSNGGAASRAALTAGMLSLAAVVAVATFVASLTHLLRTPALQGWDFDAVIMTGDAELDGFRRSLAVLENDPVVSEVGWVTIADVQIGGNQFEVYVFDPDGGAVHPTMRSGRPPLADDEIAVGADLLRGGDLSMGDTVVITGPNGDVPLAIVGSATYPELGNNSDIGTGVSLTRGAARRLGVVEHGAAALVRLKPGERTSALDDHVIPGSELITPFRSPRVRNLEQVGALPWVLVGFASVLGLLAVGHGLWSSIRVRRRDLAVLAAIGFRPRDVRAMLLWQVSCLAALAAMVGGVAGILLGTRAWSSVASATAVVDEALVPLPSIVLVIAGALIACGVVGLTGDRWARRHHIALGLRRE